jgi:SlyX protein
MTGGQDRRLQQLEETTAQMQAELTQLGDEVYAQQKEIATLLRLVDNLTRRVQALQSDSGILRSDEDRPPPHY